MKTNVPELKVSYDFYIKRNNKKNALNVAQTLRRSDILSVHLPVIKINGFNK